MTLIITAFADSPDGGEGMARDTRVRWALEELGLPYEVRPLTFEQMAGPEHRARQPFGQIPTLEDGALTLFETGAIILHLATRHPGLLPEDPDARDRAIAWMFAAVSTLEPPIVAREAAMMLEADEDWYQARLPLIDAPIHQRLAALSARLGDGPWLEGAFSAGDLMVADVLRRLGGWGIIESYPTLAAYVARAEARPAFRRAFAAQLEAFQQSQR